MNLFGKKKAPAPNMNESILKLRETITQLGKREDHLQKQADACLESAKMKSKKKDKRGRKCPISNPFDSIYDRRPIRIETQEDV
jgi:hypothetical protein